MASVVWPVIFLIGILFVLLIFAVAAIILEANNL
jgi:hypothetical protein